MDIVNFTPWQGLAGGLLLGAGAALLLLFYGRVAGFSGIISQLVCSQRTSDSRWRLVFLTGVVISGTMLHGLSGFPMPEIDTPVPVLILAGLLVGFGTRLGNGCTSGHGICGLSRFSVRSLVAVVTFMLTAMITVAITNLM